MCSETTGICGHYSAYWVSLECCRTCEKRHLFSSCLISWWAGQFLGLLCDWRLCSLFQTAAQQEAESLLGLVTSSQFETNKWRTKTFSLSTWYSTLKLCWRPGVALVFLTACFWMNNNLLSEKAIRGAIYIVGFFNSCWIFSNKSFINCLQRQLNVMLQNVFFTYLTFI